MRRFFHRALSDECGQDIAEYAVMAAVTVVIVVGIFMTINVNATQIFFQVASALR